MPAKHKYRCRNQFCSIALFVAMNAPTPTCPKCGSMKVEDDGDTTFDLGHTQTGGGVINSESRRVLQHDDRTLSRIADQYGVTDMSNKDGKPIRVPKEASSDAPKINYNGMEVPMVGGKGACVNMPGMAQKLTGTWTGGTSSAMLKSMTNVTAEHKG